MTMSTLANYLLGPSGLGMLGTGGIAYLIRDEFTTALTAGNVDGTDAEPGPGTRNVTDTESKLSLSGGLLDYSGGKSSPAYNDPLLIYSDGLTRVQGLTIQSILNSSDTNVSQFGLFTTATPSNSANNDRAEIFFRSGAGLFVVNDGNATTPKAASWSSGVDRRLTITTQTTGAYYFDGTSLIWVSKDGTTATVYAGTLSRNSAFTHDYIRTRQLQGDYATLNGHASVDISTPSSGASQTATANAIHDFELTLPGSPSNGDTMELRYRVQDANNYWTAYAEYDGTGTEWDFKVDKVSSGTPANQINVNGVGTPDTVRVIVTGSTHDFFTEASGSWTKRGGTVTDSTFSSEAAIEAVFSVGSSVKLLSWPTDGYSELTDF